MKMKRNLLVATDSYKINHWNQYVPGLERIYSYFEPRVGSEYQEIVWMGIIPYLKEYGFDGKCFSEADIKEAAEICDEHFGVPGYFNEEGWRYILETYGGKLPLRIYALPAGTIVEPGTPCMAIESTDDRVPWLTNYVESILLHCWGMTTVATISYDIYKTIKKWCDLTGETVSPFHLNDFGVRGCTSLQSAMLQGVGHLAIFQGTDNLPAIRFIKNNYPDHPMAGYSVIAAEHSTITSRGRDRECDAYRYIIEKSDKKYNVHGNKFLTISLVCDSYDYKYAVKQYFCQDLKDLVLNRNGKIVVRPDSDYPPTATITVLKMLWDAYGGTINDKGYKVLDPHIGIIFADHICADMINKICNELVKEKFAINNVIYGSGGKLLQCMTRDTINAAMKLSELTFEGRAISVCKTTPGKESKAGRFDLPLVYENSVIINEESFTTIRERIRSTL
jgi:nicotinamide phosphoribosyltransferase